ncbi:MAG: CDP-alcohol phosphatidyltransferase family protein [Gemmatimonadaceae bacterium]|nr:CDP-alcohol phosphatidyltransferase family protein [Gemmatimonadaceae bacterium]
MLDNLLRPLKDRTLDPLARALGPAVHPNALSMLGLGAGLAAAMLALRGEYPAALGVWILNRFLDGLDGAVARARGRQTDFGGYIDILADFVVYAAIPAAIVLGMPYDEDAYRALVALLGSYYVNAASWMYLAAILERRGRGAGARGDQTTVTMPAGLIGGSETVIAYVVFLMAPGYVASLFAAFAGFVAVTVFQRLAWALRNL